MNTRTTTTKFKLSARLGAWWQQRQDSRAQAVLQRRCPAAALAAAQIPPEVHAAWVRLAPQEFPGLRVDTVAWRQSAVALAQFFEACRLQRGHGPCALPSRAADSVWHVWLAVDAPGLAAWQARYFGQTVAHHEAAALGPSLDDSIARTWMGACRSEGLSPLGPRLPVVFGLDAQLGLPSGWAYGFGRQGLVHRPIDAWGRAHGSPVLHAAATGAGLVGLGLLTEAELQALRRQADASGSSCGGWMADGSSGDACSDGGSGDCSGGSSCGGGCGGD